MTPQPRRKKWTEAEERTLIDKYGEMSCDGTLSKMKTREKKYKPIALHVNSMHHVRDPVLYPWQWTWKDVSTKVQNMRHQYALVKQKIKKQDLRSGDRVRRSLIGWKGLRIGRTSLGIRRSLGMCRLYLQAMMGLEGNSNNSPRKNNNPMRPAVAAMIQGDKSAFHRCGFFGLQDTLWDEQGRHYFRHCSIQGAVDFIFGAGQSIYEGVNCIKPIFLIIMYQVDEFWYDSFHKCTISVVARALNGVPGYITAQGRSHAQDTNGFVFKNCNIVGNGKTFLGRPWREYARVVFYNTSMSSIVVPQGWDAWFSAGRE
ncbi:UNVERIFIED_CONTAM: putative pectinesterase 29 [Sesamum calycinum]|uniref:Pectinesterase n=1 Tax=Sesamum calycinum TaxID=2727403 RepID=A0AAW2QL37_9LAMI